MVAQKSKTPIRKKVKKGSLIKKYGTFLEGLSHLPPRCRQKMINDSPKEVIDCVGECCLNIIKGNVRMTKAQKQHLGPRYIDIRHLSSKQVKLKDKKQIINQKGGAILGLLLKPLLASVVGSILGGIIPRR